MKELKEWIKSKGILCQIDGIKLIVENFGNLVFIQEKDGKIIDVDAPRPSSKEIETLIEKYL